MNLQDALDKVEQNNQRGKLSHIRLIDHSIERGATPGRLYEWEVVVDE